MSTFELLYEARGLPSFELPEDIRRWFPGTLGFEEPRLYANFVATIDGTVAIPEVAQPSQLIGHGSTADKQLMGLLRACADAVIVGGGTLRGSPGALWTAERAFPTAGDAYAELRRRLERAPNPEIAIVTASGSIEPDLPVLQAGGLVLTSDLGAAALSGRLPSAATLVSLGGEATVDPAAVVALLRDRGHQVILSEAGPSLFGSFVAAGLVDELFLTLSPLLAGRMFQDGRLGLVEGVKLLPDQLVAGRLLGVRRSDEHLFLRYELAPPAAA